ncbi:MAG TPA: hypothetical protein VGI20_07980 [Rhizomicrobium sp.]|jgi:hypothetical protein
MNLVASEQRSYPDNSAIYARKSEGRRRRAALSFAEKLVALDELKARTRSMTLAREERKRLRRSPAPDKT